MAETFHLGEEREEVLGADQDSVEFETARNKQGWFRVHKVHDVGTGEVRYLWRYAPSRARWQHRREVFLAVAIGAGIIVLIVAGVAIYVNWKMDHQPAATSSAPASRSYTPVDSEGDPIYGEKFPAPANDPCWGETEEAVEASPGDGGQSAMPQECIDRGF